MFKSHGKERKRTTHCHCSPHLKAVVKVDKEVNSEVLAQLLLAATGAEGLQLLHLLVEEALDNSHNNRACDGVVVKA